MRWGEDAEAVAETFAAEIRELLAGLDAGTSIILATHLLDDVQRLCNRVIVLEAGRFGDFE